MSVKTKIANSVIKLVSKFSGVSQDETAARAAEEKTVTPGMPELLRRAASEGAVLLKNEKNTLPLSEGSIVSLFGRCQIAWFYTGYGSGGDVNKPYAVNLADGIKNCEKLKLNEELFGIYSEWNEKNPIDHGFWGHWPRFYPDMPLSGEIVKNAAAKSDCAVVTIGRSSGEDRENALEKGSYYLTDGEREMLRLVTASFEKTAVLLNIGSVIDLSWLDEFDGKITAALLVWQGGMESGNAAADLLCGKATPCGKLSDTFAFEYKDYPSTDFGNKEFNTYKEDIYVGYRYFETFAKNKVQYPFGYGLSYTEFFVSFEGVKEKEDGFEFSLAVENTGRTYAGKEVVAVYLEKPCGKLGNPSRILAGFAKTTVLAPGEKQSITLTVPRERLCSYDDSGDTGFKYAYVIEEGEYNFYMGASVRDAQKIWSFKQDKTELVEQLTQASAPQSGFKIYKAVQSGSERILKEVDAPLSKVDLRQRILDNLPKGTPMTGDKGYKLKDVKNGTVSLDDFVAQLDLTELEAISRGDYTMDSALGAKGNAGALGGVLESMRKKGIPAMITTDGPSGIRLQSCCSLMPIGTLIACSFDESLAEEMYAAAGREMTAKGSDILLAPGMNIHRNPLCGRNFEYFSEDPYLTGKIAAALVKGLQSVGVSACPKHFACNNQEYKRTLNDSRLSERALREIYLKGFEICVKQAKPLNIMTSYNRINGVYGHYNYDLCTTVLRGEWGFGGSVMTDWWMQYRKSPEFPKIKDNAYRVRAGVDVFMPGDKRVPKHKPDGTLLATYGKPDGITLGELQRTAKHVLEYILRSSALENRKTF